MGRERINPFARRCAFALAVASTFATLSGLAQDAPPAEAPADGGSPSPAPDMSVVQNADASAGSAPVSDSGSGDAGGGSHGLFSDMSATFSGFVRLEAAMHTADDPNRYNLRGNPFNGKTTGRAGGPAQGTGALEALQGQLNSPILAGLINTVQQTGSIPSTATRNTPKADDDWNLQQIRGKFDFNATITSNLTFFANLRTIYEFGRYDEWKRSDAAAPAGYGLSGPDISRAAGYNYGRPSYFSYDDYYKGGQLGYLEQNGKNWEADLAAAYFDYTAGPVLVRVGQQQIAWGQALFFRVFDVPNGLDLRRHLILDDALEEYADERRAAPGIRTTWQVTNELEADAFWQLFIPGIYPLANTPYNVIPAQFSVHESWEDEHAVRSWGDLYHQSNYGLRLRGNWGNWGAQAIAVRRYNQEGVFRWAASNVNKDLPGVPGSGLILKNTPLETDPSGVWSANEWFTYAGDVRLNGLEGLNTIIREFPQSQLLGGAVAGDKGAAARELDLFFGIAGGQLLGNLDGGGLRGHLLHEYFRENVFGIGGSHVFEAEPGSFLDQLIVNLETSYIPNRHFTEQSLSGKYQVSDESVTALVMEKYHRWFQEFPATYMVFQAIHRTEADLFGESLKCQGGTGGNPGSEAADRNSDTKVCHKVSGGSTDIVLAALQPFPNYIYRVTGATLLDVRGGLFAQAGFRWSPNGSWTLDLFYNYLDGRLYGHKNENIVERLDDFDELAIRIAYQF